MRQRGKKSAASREAASLTVIAGDFGRAPEPSSILTVAQAVIWRAIIRDEPAGFFSTAATQEMLKDYCIRRQEVDKLNEQINDIKSEQLKDREVLALYSVLLRLRNAEMAAVTQLATKLRLTNQSRYFRHTAGTAVANHKPVRGPRPWERADADH